LLAYEYGINPSVGLVGDFEFLNNFNKAGFLGIAYLKSFGFLEKENTISIALVFENKKMGEIAFGNLLHWVELSNNNGDAVGLEFVENNGGYTLCIYPDEQLLIDRTCDKHLKKWVNPLVMIPAYYKKITNISKEYKQFKELVKIKSLDVYAVDTEFEFLANRRFFNKKVVNIYNVNSIPESSPNYMHFKNGEEELSRKKISKIPKESIEKNRVKKIQYFLPISYEKILNCNVVYSHYMNLQYEYSIDQIIQAMCNINLYERIINTNMAQLLAIEEEIEINILEYLYENPEVFQSYFLDFEEVTLDKLKKQLLLDVAILNNRGN